MCILYQLMCILYQLKYSTKHTKYTKRQMYKAVNLTLNKHLLQIILLMLRSNKTFL